MAKACRRAGVLAVFALVSSPIIAKDGLAKDGGDYLLGTLDKVRVTISDGAAVENGLRPQIDGIFVIAADGAVPLPLLGPVAAAGHSPVALADAISERFRSKLGTIESPSTSVEVIEYRPFYIVGLVNQPGSHPYRPGMIVLHALGMAGGLLRPQDAGAMRLERDVVSARGDARSHEATRLALLVTLARLKAELADAPTIEATVDIRERAADAAVQAALRDEQALLEHRRSALKARLFEQEKLKELGYKRLGALKAEEIAQLRQLELLRAEVGDQKQYVTRGISTAQRTSTLEVRLAESEARRRQIEGESFAVEQEILKADSAHLNLRNARRDDVHKELKEAQAKFDDAGQKAQTARQLAWDGNLTIGGQTSESPVLYAILRAENGAMREFPATEISIVRPGDVVKVGRTDGVRNASSPSAEPARRAALDLPGVAPRM